MKKLIIILILFIGLFDVKGQTGQKNLTGDGYRITYPEQWKANQSGYMGTNFFLFSPLTGENDKFSENINLVTQNLTGTGISSLDDFVNLSENQIKTIITDAKIIQSKRITGEKYTYHQIIFEGKQSNFHLKTMQYYWVINNKAYVLTFTAQAGEFDKYLPEAKKIMHSFEIIK
jgi:hypothetical protein